MSKKLKICCPRPDVHEGLRTMYLRTHFAIDEGGFFPAVKVSTASVKAKTTSVELKVTSVEAKATSIEA